jgi:hypothetical protein
MKMKDRKLNLLSGLLPLLALVRPVVAMEETPKLMINRQLKIKNAHDDQSETRLSLPTSAQKNRILEKLRQHNLKRDELVNPLANRLVNPIASDNQRSEEEILSQIQKPQELDPIRDAQAMQPEEEKDPGYRIIETNDIQNPYQNKQIDAFESIKNYVTNNNFDNDPSYQKIVESLKHIENTKIFPLIVEEIIKHRIDPDSSEGEEASERSAQKSYIADSSTDREIKRENYLLAAYHETDLSTKFDHLFNSAKNAPTYPIRFSQLLEIILQAKKNKITPDIITRLCTQALGIAENKKDEETFLLLGILHAPTKKEKSQLFSKLSEVAGTNKEAVNYLLMAAFVEPSAKGKSKLHEQAANIAETTEDKKKALERAAHFNSNPAEKSRLYKNLADIEENKDEQAKYLILSAENKNDYKDYKNKWPLYEQAFKLNQDPYLLDQASFYAYLAADNFNQRRLNEERFELEKSGDKKLDCCLVALGRTNDTELQKIWYQRAINLKQDPQLQLEYCLKRIPQEKSDLCKLLLYKKAIQLQKNPDLRISYCLEALKYARKSADKIELYKQAIKLEKDRNLRLSYCREALNYAFNNEDRSELNEQAGDAAIDPEERMGFFMTSIPLTFDRARKSRVYAKLATEAEKIGNIRVQRECLQGAINNTFDATKVIKLYNKLIRLSQDPADIQRYINQRNQWIKREPNQG